MSTAPWNPRKRKACLTCTRAKAKCSPSEHGPDCRRCQRLNKQCLFPEEAAKKPGPKSRSRVKQLEQRVESLIDLIAAKSAVGGSSGVRQPEKSIPMQEPTPSDCGAPDAASAGTPPETPSLTEASTFQTYDPVSAGLIDEHYAYRLVNEFKTSFIFSFPFVVVDADAITLRRQQPFLFHAILAVTSHESPRSHCLLGDELRRQIARTIEHSHKNLEILQGLLVYAGWYHSFYHPASQQLATIVQLCVALVQDLGFSRNHKKKAGLASVMHCGPPAIAEDAVAGKRAFLGTYFLTVTCAQAWRKRTTLPYTTFMAQCCESFAESPVSTDALITPLIQLCELVSRVNDYFSYDDIENSEINGELMLEMSTKSFRSELTRIEELSSRCAIAKQSTTMNLMFILLDVWIHECCLHSSLWHPPTRPGALLSSLTRFTMLRRTMNAAISYLEILLHTPEAQFYQLGLQSWAAWFYAVVVICKLVFLEDNERLGNTFLGGISEEIDNLNLESGGPDNDNTRPHNTREQSGWVPLSVAREYDIQGLLDRFMDKLKFTLPPDQCSPPWTVPRDKRDCLHSIAFLQHNMLHGFTKRIQRLATSENAHGRVSTQYNGPQHFDAATPAAGGFSSTTASIVPSACPKTWISEQDTHAAVQGSLPFADLVSFDSVNFDGVTLPASFPVQQNGFEDWIWDTIMDDFTMPSM